MSNIPVIPLDSCLACGSHDLHRYLDLGAQPLANSFHDGTKTLPTFPLTVNVCRECWHSQLSMAVDPTFLFKDYVYVSGTTQTLRDYFKWFVEKVEGDFSGRKLRVLEIGSNDGSLLREFIGNGHFAFGVDPAGLTENFTHKSFWNGDAVEKLERTYAPFDIIIAMNVLAHVDNPTGFLALAKRVLAPGGRIYVQTSQAKMLLNGEFDTVYHEHVSYFTARSMRTITTRVGLVLESIEHAPIHGTSMLAKLTNDQTAELKPFSIEINESRMGYYTPVIYDRFRELAEHTRDQTRKMVASCRNMGYRIVGYGAAAKGMTFLNYTGIELDYIVDDNPLKQGKLCPGSNIPVRAPEGIFPGESEKFMWLIPAWNFREEIIERIKTRRPNGRDLFLTYFPRMVCSG